MPVSYPILPPRQICLPNTKSIRQHSRWKMHYLLHCHDIPVVRVDVSACNRWVRLRHNNQSATIWLGNVFLKKIWNCGGKCREIFIVCFFHYMDMIFFNFSLEIRFSLLQAQSDVYNGWQKCSWSELRWLKTWFFFEKLF